MVYFSHFANVAILIFVCAALFRKSPELDAILGPDSPARGILTCIYATILATSLYALVQAGLGAPHIAVSIALVLFPLQIIYKTATLFVVGSDNPVVVANLAVAALHSFTLITLWYAA